MNRLILILFLFISNAFLSQTIESKRKEIDKSKKYALSVNLRTKSIYLFESKSKDSTRVHYESYDEKGCIKYFKSHHYRKKEDYIEERYRNDSLGRRVVEQHSSTFRPRNHVAQLDYSYEGDSITCIRKMNGINTKRPRCSHLKLNYGKRTLPIIKKDSLGRIKSEFFDFGDQCLYHYSDSGYYEVDLITGRFNSDVKFYYNDKKQTIAYKSLNDVRKKHWEHYTFDYNEEGKLIKETSLNKKGNIISVTKYDYFENGLEKSVKKYDSNQVLVNKKKFYYTYYQQKTTP